MTYAAFIRGAIAFGLVESLDDHYFAQKDIIVSTTLCLVISSTIIFGSFTPIVQMWLLPSKTPQDSGDNTDKLLKSDINSSMGHNDNPNNNQAKDEHLKALDARKAVQTGPAQP